MKENQENVKTCQSCRYYSQHYSKQGVEYDLVFCGHCMNMAKKNKKKDRIPEVCELWEDIAIKKEERKKSIKETLIFMSERLNEILMILKDDE